MSIVSSLLSTETRLESIVSSLLSTETRLVSIVSSLLSTETRLESIVSSLLSTETRLESIVSSLLSTETRLVSIVSSLVFTWLKLVSWLFNLFEIDWKDKSRLFLAAPDKSPIKYWAVILWLKSQVSVDSLYNIDGLSPLLLCISIPAPSASVRLLEPLANKIVLSLISTCVELTIVWEPSTCRSPLIITLPALPVSPLIPYGLGSI